LPEDAKKRLDKSRKSAILIEVMRETNKYEKPKLMKYGNQNYFVEKAIIVFFVLWGIATIFNVAYSAELEIVPVKQKVLPNGNAYGLESGIYFKLTDLEPFIMYKLQYSEDLTKWTNLVHLGTYKMSMTSPYWTWKELPPYKCFFRIVVAW
jgi:hypothetical protein